MARNANAAGIIPSASANLRNTRPCVNVVMRHCAKSKKRRQL